MNKVAPKRRLSPKEKARVAALFDRFLTLSDDPRTELKFQDPFTLVVAVALSAQATDVQVNKATAKLFPVAHTPQQMLALGEAGLTGYINSIGLFRNKAKNVILLSRRLIDAFAGAVPADREALVSLPGVGRKTANVVLNIAFGQPTIAVDTHLFRVSNRLPIARGTTPEQVEHGLERRVPDAFRLHCHHWLILHGRYICKAQKPECWRCPLAEICRFEPKSPPPRPKSPSYTA